VVSPILARKFSIDTNQATYDYNSLIMLYLL
jgi:hypothetical protein